jgi:hypothetical protein
MELKKFGFLFALLLSTTTASADWQFTKWRMSAAELTALDASIASTTPTEQQDHSNPHVGRADYKSRYQAKDIVFTAYYMFNAGKLAAVQLVPNNVDDGAKSQSYPGANIRRYRRR